MVFAETNPINVAPLLQCDSVIQIKILVFIRSLIILHKIRKMGDHVFLA